MRIMLAEQLLSMINFALTHSLIGYVWVVKKIQLNSNSNKLTYGNNFVLMKLMKPFE